jgi:hypothetical protein
MGVGFDTWIADVSERKAIGAPMRDVFGRLLRFPGEVGAVEEEAACGSSWHWAAMRF